ncbi:tetratricopeptide repeat protein [Granulicella sp. L46]|uniref:tetratricopeptide repeat protein n=1 Tax=Granulicella sp. L46 TaxID=1641865 RepID=UPI00131E8EBF|nr:tetratricopeptide repeat protein [Granulicella sp. L46]
MSSNRGMEWMRGLRKLGLVSVGVGVMLAAQGLHAQQQGGCTFTDESGKTVFWPNCQDPADKKAPTTPANGQTQTQAPGQTPAAGDANPAKSFPFPGDSSAAPGNAPTAPGTQQGGTGSSSTGSPAAGTPGGGAASKFPFPGEDSAGAPGSGPLKDSGSSGNSSSSSSGSSSSGPPERDPTAGPLGDDADTDPAAKAAEARRAARAKKGIDFHQTTDQREAEDLRVASFYRDDGNFRGMYERATDAVALADDDAEAHLALADAARRLGKLDEAMMHYKKCLTLDPVPKTKKAAEKALKEMTSGG